MTLRSHTCSLVAARMTTSLTLCCLSAVNLYDTIVVNRKLLSSSFKLKLNEAIVSRFASMANMKPLQTDQLNARMMSNARLTARAHPDQSFDTNHTRESTHLPVGRCYPHPTLCEMALMLDTVEGCPQECSYQHTRESLEGSCHAVVLDQ